MSLNVSYISRVFQEIFDLKEEDLLEALKKLQGRSD